MLETHIIEQINNKLLEILNIQNNDWNQLTEQEKIRVLHRLLATINKKESKNVIILLQNSKPKKLILSYCGFNKKTEMYKKFWIQMLTYTRNYRKQIDKKIYQRYSNLPQLIYKKILNEINFIVYTIINDNKDKIDITFLYNNIMQNNVDKTINNNITELKIEYNENILLFKFNSVHITFKLIFSKDIIGNEIPVKYIINAEIFL